MARSLEDQLLQAGLQASDPQPAEEREAVAPAEEVRFAPKVVVRYSRKGRGGKDVTLISGIEVGREDVLARLRRELGTGGRIDGDVLVIQGHQVERVARWLESRGASRVVRN